MASYRILHCADLHLDSPLRGLEADPDAPADRIRGATRAALVNLVELAISDGVAVVLIAGDLYDGDWMDWRTGQFLLEQLGQLTRRGIRVVAISGNHDAESVITRRLRWPDGARILSADRPETVSFPELALSVHGHSFRTRDVVDNLVPAYPPPVAGHLNVGLLHTALTGRPGHASYAPCTVEQLAAHGYDYWALGHVHERCEVSRDPWIVFPGNTQGRHVREPGAKGATMVTVHNGQIVSAEPRALDVVRWARITADLTGAADEDAAMSRIRGALAAALEAADGRLLAVRLVLEGACIAHAALARDIGAVREMARGEALACGGADAIWLEKVVLATRPALDLAAMRGRADAVGLLVREIETAALTGPADQLRGYCAGLLERAGGLRAALGEEHPAVLAAASGTVPPELLARARALLLARLAAD